MRSLQNQLSSFSFVILIHIFVFPKLNKNLILPEGMILLQSVHIEILARVLHSMRSYSSGKKLRKWKHIVQSGKDESNGLCLFMRMPLFLIISLLPSDPIYSLVVRWSYTKQNKNLR